MRAYFTDLCGSIGASMIADHDRLSLTATVDDSAVGADVSVSLGLIVTELVINALKHAFPGHDPLGKIAVDYLAKGTGWTLSVSDNGIGMPAGESPKPRLGTVIVEALSRQLDASVRVSDAAPGTRVTIVQGRAPRLPDGMSGTLARHAEAGVRNQLILSCVSRATPLCNVRYTT